MTEIFARRRDRAAGEVLAVIIEAIAREEQMPHRVVAAITYQEQVFPPDTPAIALYRVTLFDPSGQAIDSQDFAPPGPDAVTFAAPPPGSGYTVRAEQRDAGGAVIDGAVLSTPFTVGADVTLVVVSGVSVSVVVAG